MAQPTEVLQDPTAPLAEMTGGSAASGQGVPGCRNCRA